MKQILTALSLCTILVTGIYAVLYADRFLSASFDGGEVSAVSLYEDPEDYDVSGAEGIADVIVEENLEKTRAANNVASVVFDFRGFDTLGESFILLTAIAGAFIILANTRKPEEEKKRGGQA